MSLRIWLPLDGDLHNQGISDLNTINMPSSATVDNTGKIGKCYTSSGAVNGVSTNLSFSASQFSIAAWVRINTRVNSWRCPFKLINSTAGDYIGFCCEHNTQATYVGFHFYKTIDGTNTSIFDAYPITDMTVGQWTHLVVTYDGKVATYYKNGIKVSSTTVATARQNTAANIDRIIMLGSDGGRGGAAVKSSLNDVRIYDECLSAATIHEIAQGLVLHYKLDGGLFGNANLYTGSEKFTGSWNGSAAWTTSSETYQNFVVKEKSTVWGGLSQNITCTQGDVFTISFWGKVESGGTIRSIHRSNLGNVTTGLTILDGNFMVMGDYWVRTTDDGTQWKKYWATLQISSSDVTYLQWRLENSTADKKFQICGIKLEKGPVATPWCPADSEMNIDRTIIEDSSGYNHNGSILNNVLISSDTPRYSNSTNLVAGNSAINCGRGGMVTDSITVNMWLKSSAWGNPVSCTEGGGWNFESSGDGFRFPVYLAGVGYKATGVTTTTRAQLCNNQWHMITGVYDRLNQKIRVYIDANLEYEENTSSSALIGYHSSNVIWIGAEASGSATTIGSNGMAGLFSDFRIYCTPLLDTDIKQLYNVGMKIDKSHNIHTYELLQEDKNKLYKTGVLCNSNFNEINNLFNLLYDKQLYIEPDESCWIRIFHHANCDTKLFASSDTFTTSVYKDADRWFNVSLCNKVNKWELMVKSMPTTGGTETKYRWIQTKNPMTAAYADVAAASVTKVTGNGYAAYGWGGLYHIGSSTYLATNNGTNGNWWGAVGAWAHHQNGIPGWTTVITTGYEDVYLRIDNLDQVNLHVKNIKAGMWTANQFIEK